MIGERGVEIPLIKVKKFERIPYEFHGEEVKGEVNPFLLYARNFLVHSIAAWSINTSGDLSNFLSSIVAPYYMVIFPGMKVSLPIPIVHYADKEEKIVDFAFLLLIGYHALDNQGRLEGRCSWVREECGLKGFLIHHVPLVALPVYVPLVDGVVNGDILFLEEKDFEFYASMGWCIFYRPLEILFGGLFYASSTLMWIAGLKTLFNFLRLLARRISRREFKSLVRREYKGKWKFVKPLLKWAILLTFISALIEGFVWRVIYDAMEIEFGIELFESELLYYLGLSSDFTYPALSILIVYWMYRKGMILPRRENKE